VEVRKAYADDFERVYPLLQAHDPRLSRDIWRRLFQRPWPAPLDHYGYLLLAGSQCVGFLGAIFSRRRLGGQEYDCCNISTWVVREDFRNQSLSLMFPLLKLKDWVITNLTPSREVCRILKHFGFKELDAGFKIFPPFIQKRSRDCRVSLEPRDLVAHLTPKELQILDDQLPLACRHLLLESPRGYCYLIASRIVKKKVPLARLDYIGNHQILSDNLGNVVNALAIRLRVTAVIIDDRLLPSGDYWRAFSWRFKEPRLYKGFNGDRQLLDNLYSELVILGI
jgi:hypothetical protein